jgi:hypothetical protein
MDIEALKKLNKNKKLVKKLGEHRLWREWGAATMGKGLAKHTSPGSSGFTLECLEGLAF